MFHGITLPLGQVCLVCHGLRFPRASAEFVLESRTPEVKQLCQWRGGQPTPMARSTGKGKVVSILMETTSHETSWNYLRLLPRRCSVREWKVPLKSWVISIGNLLCAEKLPEASCHHFQFIALSGGSWCSQWNLEMKWKDHCPRILAGSHWSSQSNGPNWPQQAPTPVFSKPPQKFLSNFSWSLAISIHLASMTIVHSE